MISKPKTSECFVYITLPGQTSAVTAGRFELTSDKNGNPRGRFVYGKKYLALSNSLEFDPVELKLSDRTYETMRLKGVFGALRDASPDYWGRSVIERHSGKSQLSELDYLLYSSEDRAGALGFGLSSTPPAPQRKFNQKLDLEHLQRIADALISEEDLPASSTVGQISELMLIGTSMGGARPKVSVEDQEGLWLAKFNRTDDKWNNARVEHSMLLLARSCGIATAESRLISISGRDVLLIKRFDREKIKKGYLRARMISGLTLLGTEDTHQARDKWSYLLLSEELRRVSGKPKHDALELFKRMCFNALISNIDDHPRNHAIIAQDHQWQLSPAYDLTPSTPISLERRDLALSIGDAGRYANAENILSQCLRFLLKPDEAEALVNDMEKRVKATWYQVARSTGVSEGHCGLISGAFAYPGFRLPLSRSPSKNFH